MYLLDIVWDISSPLTEIALYQASYCSYAIAPHIDSTEARLRYMRKIALKYGLYDPNDYRSYRELVYKSIEPHYDVQRLLDKLYGLAAVFDAQRQVLENIMVSNATDEIASFARMLLISMELNLRHFGSKSDTEAEVLRYYETDLREYDFWNFLWDAGILNTNFNKFDEIARTMMLF